MAIRAIRRTRISTSAASCRWRASPTVNFICAAPTKLPGRVTTDTGRPHASHDARRHRLATAAKARNAARSPPIGHARGAVMLYPRRRTKHAGSMIEAVRLPILTGWRGCSPSWPSWTTDDAGPHLHTPSDRGLRGPHRLRTSLVVLAARDGRSQNSRLLGILLHSRQSLHAVRKLCILLDPLPRPP